MNKHKLTILALSSVLLATSCRKVDLPVQEQPVTTQGATTNPTSAFKQVASWNQQSEEKFTSFSASIKETTLSTAVVNNGMVLVFLKEGSSVKALPFQEGNRYWYYQASEGDITINCDAYGATRKMNEDASFATFVISAEKIEELTGKGKSKADLMNLSYEEAVALLK